MLSRWIADLESADPNVRSLALQGLQQLGPAAREGVPALIAVLQKAKGDPEQEQLLNDVIWTLKEIGPDARAAVPLLVSLMPPAGERSRYWLPEAILRIGGSEQEEQIAVRSLLLRWGKTCELLLYNPELMEQWADKILPCLADLLTEPDERSRSIAVRGLAKYGDKAKKYVPALVAALNDSEFQVRIQVAEALTAIEPERKSEAIAALFPLLSKPEATSAISAALSQLGADVVPPLLSLLRQQEGEAQMPYILALQANGASSIPALVQELRGSSVAGRAGAARTLGLLTSQAQTAFENLVAVLGDVAAEMRYSVAQLLVRIDASRASSAVPHLIAGLESADPGRRGDAANMLALLGKTAVPALPALRKALQDPKMRREAALALVAIEAGQAAVAVPVLVQALQAPGSPSSGTSAAAILAALGRIGRPAAVAVPLLRQSLPSPDGGVRLSAAVALVRVAPEFTTEAVKTLMSDVENQAGAGAIEALAEIGPAAREIVPRIEAILLDLYDEEKRWMWDANLLFWALVKIDSTAGDRVLEHIVAAMQSPDRFDQAVGFLTEILSVVPATSAPLLARLLQEQLKGATPERASWINDVLARI